MIMSKYCKEKGMDYKEFQQFKENIKATAKAIINQLEYKGGQYYSVDEILGDVETDIKHFLIQQLKELGLEFTENNTLYRVTD